jgi:pyruvate dehydrogenase E1 component alpha subunit
MDQEQKKAALAADPYPAYRTKLISSGIATEAVLAGVEARIEAELDDAVAFALDASFPGLEEMTRDVYGAVI